jgi:hypothetical protein
MPLLPPIPDLEFHPDAHRYRYQGDWLPWSTTQIVSDLTPEAKAHIERTKDGPNGWAIRGTTIHGWLESHLLGEAEASHGDFSAWIEALRGCWLWKDCEVLAVEYRLCDPLKRVAGSFDFLLRTGKGTVVLGDLKSVGSAPAAKSRKTADAQLGSYVHMLAVHHPNITVERCVTVVSGPGVCEVKSSEVDACCEAWVNAWERFSDEQELLWGF